jgi:hypothetical protein
MKWKSTLVLKLQALALFAMRALSCWQRTAFISDDPFSAEMAALGRVNSSVSKLPFRGSVRNLNSAAGG